LANGWTVARHLDKVRRTDSPHGFRSYFEAVKTDAQGIYQAPSRGLACDAFYRFKWRWGGHYPGMGKQLEKDLPELLAFFSFHPTLWRKLRTTNIIARVFVEVRRRPRPMVCFINVDGVDRIIFSIFQRFNLEWRTPL
jgi:transposase-like protein